MLGEELLEYASVEEYRYSYCGDGEDFRSSLRAVALLKEGGVKRIFARAIDDLHQSILEAFSIDRILTPEKRAAEDLSNELNFHSQVTSLSVTQEYLVSKLEVPKKFVGFPYRNFNLSRFGLILISATRKKVSKNLLGLVTEEEILLDIDRKAQEETGRSGGQHCSSRDKRQLHRFC